MHPAVLQPPAAAGLKPPAAEGPSGDALMALMQQRNQEAMAAVQRRLQVSNRALPSYAFQDISALNAVHSSPDQDVFVLLVKLHMFPKSHHLLLPLHPSDSSCRVPDCAIVYRQNYGYTCAMYGKIYFLKHWPNLKDVFGACRSVSGKCSGGWSATRRLWPI